MKKGIRFACLLLSLVLLIGMTPSSVFAEVASLLPSADEEGVYRIGSADELFAFAELARTTAEGDTGGVRTPLRAKLTADINLNPGVTFSYDHATGLVTVKKGDLSYRMGTGMQETEVGVFHPVYNGLCTAEEWNAEPETEEERAALEEKKARLTEEMAQKVAQLELRTWTPLGTKALPYIGFFDGDGHTVDGLYINEKASATRDFSAWSGTINMSRVLMVSTAR